MTQDQVEKMLAKLEEKWVSTGPEVPSSSLGEDLMKELKKLDQVAYIRYASIHREFTDVEEFKEEITKLWATKKAGKK